MNQRAGGKQAARDGKGRFAKGVSGNAGGRPKVPEELREAFREACPVALKTLVRVVKDPKAKDADRIRAAEAILDRGYGKPVQAVDVDASAVQQVVFVGENEIAD